MMPGGHRCPGNDGSSSLPPATSGCGTSWSPSTLAWPGDWPTGSPIGASPTTTWSRLARSRLIKAVDRFDPERGVEFTTYATGTVIGELKRHFRDKGWAVRAPRRIQELYLELGHTIDALSQELGRPPTVPELAESIGVSQDAILEAIEAGQGYRSSSIDAPGQRDETLADRLGADDAEVAVVDERSVLAPALAALPERQQEVVRLRFVDGLTQSEIAARVGISQMHVSRLLAQSLARIRENLADER